MLNSWACCRPFSDKGPNLSQIPYKNAPLTHDNLAPRDVQNNLHLSAQSIQIHQYELRLPHLHLQLKMEQRQPELHVLQLQEQLPDR